jgi:hypothetical protein
MSRDVVEETDFLADSDLQVKAVRIILGPSAHLAD